MNKKLTCTINKKKIISIEKNIHQINLLNTIYTEYSNLLSDYLH